MAPPLQVHPDLECVVEFMADSELGQELLTAQMLRLEVPLAQSCSPSQPTSDQARPCPVSGFSGEPVAWLTVVALTAGPVPPKQEFWLCRDPACDVVYFGSLEALISTRELRTEPDFKAGAAGFVCYCFLHRHEEVAARGGASVFEEVQRKVKAGDCACEVRNPSGKCCLRDLRKLLGA